MKTYHRSKNCNQEDFYRTVKISEYMGLNGVGPRVLEYRYIEEVGQGVITMERLPYSFNGTRKQDVDEMLEGVDRKLFIHHVNAKIDLMHSLGYAHGDLHIGNIIFNKDPFYIYIIDFETVYNIEEGRHDPEVLDLMKYGYEWDGTYDEFVNMDYTHWRKYV